MNYEIIDQDGIECLSPLEVSKLLKVSKTEAYNIFHSDGFPSFRLGEKKLRVIKRDFITWLNQQSNNLTT